LNQLTWHDGFIPANEIWSKLGGDKGGSSVKISFQIVNSVKPNSVENSCISCLFEAPDSVLNLHLALDQYYSCACSLQKAKWKECSIRVFMSGDYELLCNIYGISGVCPPGLHITLGIFQRLFNLLEEKCHQL
uniref:Uncharacterized protein n=1 Tax=Amphimedon queenslandica TaxID=400682 RepID=A0A1X7VBE2_AMPQE